MRGHRRLAPLLLAALAVACTSSTVSHRRALEPLASDIDLAAFEALELEMVPLVALARGPAPRIAWTIVSYVDVLAPGRFDSAPDSDDVRTLHAEIAIDRYNPGWPFFGVGRSLIRGTLVLRSGETRLARYEIQREIRPQGSPTPDMDAVERDWAGGVARLIVFGR